MTFTVPFDLATKPAYRSITIVSGAAGVAVSLIEISAKLGYVPSDLKPDLIGLVAPAATLALGVTTIIGRQRAHRPVHFLRT